MKNLYIAMAIGLFLCIIVSTIIPSHIARDLVEETVFKKRSKTYIRKMKKQIPWRKRFSLSYLLALPDSEHINADSKYIKRQIRLYWLYWMANIGVAIMFFLSALGLVYYKTLLYLHLPKLCLDLGIYISWASKHGKYNK